MLADARSVLPMSASTALRYRLLGRTGLRVSEFCLGTMVFGDERGGWGASAAEAAAIVEGFSEAGGNYLDTANVYSGSNSERILGELIAGQRDRWVLATKYALSLDWDDPNAGGTHRKSLRRAVEGSLTRLGTDYLDLLWVHIWDAYTPVEEVLRALDDLVRSGKVLALGISDTPAWLVARAVTLAEERGLTPFAALQVPYSLVERTVERELLPAARALDLTVTGWAPLGGGLLSGRYGTDRERATDTRLAGIGGTYEQEAVSARNLAIADAVNAVAAARDATASQVALAWLRAQQRRAVIIPIVGVRTEAQLLDNLGALDLELDPADLVRLNEASALPPEFPASFGGARMAHGNRFELVEDHRGLIDPMVHPHN